MLNIPERHEAFFRALVENAFELITVLDKEGLITYENPSNATFIGYSQGEILGQQVFQLIHPDDLPQVQALFAHAVSRPGTLQRATFRLRHKDGSWRWIESLGDNLLDNPEVQGVVVNSRDVTERVLADEKIRELNEVRNTFIGIVAHQLRTPLSAIRWNLETLIEETGSKLSVPETEYLTSAYKANIEVISRINDMLTALDIEEGRIVLKRERISVEGLGAPILEALKKRCDDKGISLAYEGPADLPTVHVDAAKIRDVFWKLADNAASYTPRGGAVTVRVQAKPKVLRFEIQDNGVGIPKDEQEKIFRRFYRASNASAVKPDADGVGLSIAKYYVEQHGGTIGFTSALGKGSTFWFELPL